jgi:Flp pilus assembly protein TadG
MRRLKDEDGQAVAWMVLMLVVMMGLAGISIDCGHAYVSKRQLQASTDAAALAAAYAMSLTGATTSSVQAQATAYSAASGGVNTNPNLSGVSITTTLQCLSTVTNFGIYCSSSPTGYNAVQVVQTATIQTLFNRIVSIFGASATATLTVKAESTAAMRGSQNAPYNVAIIIDTTRSMSDQDTDANCNNTRIYCALAGMRVMLQALSPCGPGSTSSNCTSTFDQVALFTFPPVVANVNTGKTLYSTQDTVCNTTSPTIPSTYLLPTAGGTWAAPTTGNATYQLTSFLNNYSSTNQPGGTLATASGLVVAAGGSGNSNCTGLQTPGGLGTYLAGAIYAAQSALVTAKANNPGSQNAMIILSDGASNASSFPSGTSATSTTYPSKIDQCAQSVAAANYASNNGTTVYTVAYGASTSGGASQCTTDATLSPCTELQEMATNAGDFYSDATASQNNGQCTSTANPNLNLNQIFKQVAGQFTVARLIPNGSS